MNYWDRRYKMGGKSGEGSIGELRIWKWYIINKHGGIHDSVIDVGCGDMSFWNGIILPNNYIGIDFSKFIIERNSNIYIDKKFYNNPSSKLLPIFSNNVICFDMLFHIMDNDEYIKTLNNICKYSNNKIFIYTWVKNPLSKKYYIFETISDGYEFYRDPIIMIKHILDNNFILESIETNDIDIYGSMFIFKKRRIIK